LAKIKGGVWLAGFTTRSWKYDPSDKNLVDDEAFLANLSRPYVAKPTPGRVAIITENDSQRFSGSLTLT
jgi:hypothetical protein